MHYTDEPEDLLPIGVTARHLGVSVETIRRWESKGQISSVRTIGNQRRFLMSEIQRVKTESSAAA